MASADLEEKAIKETVFSDASSEEPELPPNLQKIAHRGILGTLRHYESILDRKLGVESHGPARILPEARDPAYAKWSNQIVMALMWASGTMNLSCFATGFLGWELGLDLGETIWITIVASFLGSAVTGWCATMGPGTGLRQVSICRYSFGWWPSKIIAALNVVEQLGWSSVGCITGGLALSAVSDGRVNLALGVVIVSIIGLVFSLVGLRAVLSYEKYAWFVFLIVFLVMYGEGGYAADLSAPPTAVGMTGAGYSLTLFAVIYGSSASWCSIVSDYYVHYPVNTSKTKVFILTTLGIAVPTCIGMLLGCICASGLNNNQDWSDAYDEGIGYFIQTMVYPRGFAKFLLVILVMSGIGMNCIAIYSAALSIQQFARPLAIIPRFVWTLVVFVGIILLGIAGRDHLLTVLQNFLSLLGYWNTSLFVIVAWEHYVIRKGHLGYQGYDLEGWNDPKVIPVGIAGLFAFLCGWAGAIVGMQETWYTGPIAKMIGDYGGDVGNQLALAFTLATYPPVRYLELKYIGR